MVVKKLAKYKTPDDKQIDYLETRYMYEQRQKIYLANEETNQAWDESDIPDVIAAWNNNWSIPEIAEYLGADRREMELLMADLIHRGKIQGTIHVFKPKRKEKTRLATIKIGEFDIRAIAKNKEIWVCLKDVWKWIEKPDHSYRKTIENWDPSQRAKFKLETPGGPQQFHFINMDGLIRLQTKHMDQRRREMLEVLKGEMTVGLGISSGHKRITNKKQQGQKEKSGSRRISAEHTKKNS